MELYGKTCASCGKLLTPEDNIVVCPDCGAPYHRACYEEAGQCLFADKHAPGYTYAPERPQAVEDAERAAENSTEVHTKLCMHCYTTNDADAIFCTNCGSPMAKDAEKKPEADGPIGGAMYAQLMPDPVSPDERFDDITAKDWSTYLGNSAPYYLYQFKHMDKVKRKTSFCWSAVLFAPVYFCYRKAWLWGALSMLASIVLSLPALFYYMALSGSPYVVPLTEEMLLNLNMICNILSWGVQILWGVFAIYLVRKSSAKKLQAMQSAAKTPQAFSDMLAQQAGPSKVGVGIAVGAYILFGILFSLLLGPNIGNLYSLFL